MTMPRRHDDEWGQWHPTGLPAPTPPAQPQQQQQMPSSMPSAPAAPVTGATPPPPAPYTGHYRGGAQAAAQQPSYMSALDSLKGYWAQRIGRTPTDDEVNRFLSSFSGYAAQLGRTPTGEDLLNFAAVILNPQPKPVQTGYLQMGEI